MSVRKGSNIIANSALINISAVDDVLVDGTSVVTDKVAEIDLTGKQNKLSSANAGTNVSITEVGGVVKINATNSGGTDDFDELTNRPSYNGTVMTHSTNIPEVKTATWDGKQNAITGAATTITSSNLTTDRALISNASGKVVVSEVTSTELGYLDGVTSSIQTQLNGKATTLDITTAISTHNADNTAHSDIRSAISGKSTVSVSDTGTSEDEVQYITIDGVEKKLAGGSDGGYHPDLFDHKWSDHQLNDVQWLRADTFSWQSGSVYQAAYKHLRNDMYNWYSWGNNGTTIYTKKAYPEVGEKAYSDSALTTEVGEITAVTDTLDITVEKITVNNVVYDSVSGSSVTPTTETVDGITVHYIPAEDGHKIVTSFDETEVADIYAATGVAWYYIIDYGNRRFKLPRTKFGFTGLRDTVGKYVEAGLPNISGYAELWGASIRGDATGALVSQSGGTNNQVAAGGSNGNNLGFNASGSNSIYGNSNTVQPQATQMYLYFYVGQFTQTALENTAGLNAELFNEKQDVLTGVSGGGDYVVSWQTPNAGNNYTWYRKYKSGWVEQGGTYGGSQNQTISLPVEMTDNKYSLMLSFSTTSGNTPVYASYAYRDKTTTSFVAINSGSINGDWQVSGMAA